MILKYIFETANFKKLKFRKGPSTLRRIYIHENGFYAFSSPSILINCIYMIFIGYLVHMNIPNLYQIIISNVMNDLITSRMKRIIRYVCIFRCIFHVIQSLTRFQYFEIWILHHHIQWFITLLVQSQRMYVWLTLSQWSNAGISMIWSL